MEIPLAIQDIPFGRDLRRKRLGRAYPNGESRRRQGTKPMLFWRAIFEAVNYRTVENSEQFSIRRLIAQTIISPSWRITVGSQSLSLRHSGYPELSLTRFDEAKNPSIRGLCHTNLRTTRQRLRAKILSIRPFLSKAPDARV